MESDIPDMEEFKVSETLLQNPNYIAWIAKFSDGSLKDYKGKYVAFLGGNLIASGENKIKVMEDVNRTRKGYSGNDRPFMGYILKNGENQPVVRIPTSRSIESLLAERS